jgi:Leu/Phe-tRNA-protein transferase
MWIIYSSVKITFIDFVTKFSLVLKRSAYLQKQVKNNHIYMFGTAKYMFQTFKKSS